ncbi:retrotransposon ty1-copia subclass [Lasius niger]|uniref:Retrotransposon ty1-copia subclass n=1 Tax=Lasius niger TaxID=67767 RepID=A0A0J7KSQ0_LASNI|nr:retrotransposon ty1-copia subclass [Lasius niger]
MSEDISVKNVIKLDGKNYQKVSGNFVTGREWCLRCFSALAAITSSSSSTQGTNKKSKKDVECFFCKRKGYYARNCRKKKQQDKGSENEKSGAQEGAFIATCNGSGGARPNPR